MSLRYIVPLLAISIAFCRCANDTTKLLPPVPQECGEVIALKNGQPWPGIAGGAAWKDSGKLNSYFYVYSEEGFVRETLTFINLLPMIGKKQKLGGFRYGQQKIKTAYGAYSLSFGDGDAHGGSWFTRDFDSTGYVVIDSITKHRVWGRFDSIVLYPDTFISSYVTDTFEFTEGRFEGCVYD